MGVHWVQITYLSGRELWCKGVRYFFQTQITGPVRALAVLRHLTWLIQESSVEMVCWACCTMVFLSVFLVLKGKRGEQWIIRT